MHVLGDVACTPVEHVGEIVELSILHTEYFDILDMS